MDLTSNFREKSNWAGLFLYLKLLILLWLVRILFILFNQNLLQGNDVRWLKTFSWSFLYDSLLIILFIIPLLLFPVIARNKLSRVAYSALPAFMLLLNLSDVFYFRFHHQRASADMLYVLSGVEGSFIKHFIVGISALLVISVLMWLIMRWLKVYGSRADRSFIALLVVPVLFFLPAGFLLPSYPLTVLRSNELMISQNSLHTFAYSVFRKQESSLHAFDYFDDGTADSSFHKFTAVMSKGDKRNIMLFIMESVPADFFLEGPYKTTLPFFDSLLLRSTWFENAYSYSHNSNKGITAILASLPTLTDIPLYHSGFSTLPKTSIGDVLQQRGYESSFFIGDSYDDFGFAKFCNWTGINYFSREDMNVSKQADRHTLGLHDEQVAEFVSGKIIRGKKPFFSIFYNLSTHFPNDLPRNFTPDPSLTTPMNAMRYYDQVVGKFFNRISDQPWFSNTVFIFCSDHWMFPDHKNEMMDAAGSFRIPLIIYDPASDTTTRCMRYPVSQFDILPTILSYAGMDTTVISYGRQLSKPDSNRIVFARENNVLYQAFDKDYVLGLNVVNNKVEFLYSLNSITRTNLAGKGMEAEARLKKALQAFLQVSANHYRRR